MGFNALRDELVREQLQVLLHRLVELIVGGRAASQATQPRQGLAKAGNCSADVTTVTVTFVRAPGKRVTPSLRPTCRDVPAC